MDTPAPRTSEAPPLSALGRRIVEQLEHLPIRRIVLFGSRVWGDPHPDSDLDVLVVLKSANEPQTSVEKGRLYRQISRPLRDLQQQYPLDLLVHSEGMHQRFRARDSAFARQVLDEGKVIYEASN
jgi:predicted nucleotidyltransferase